MDAAAKIQRLEEHMASRAIIIRWMRENGYAIPAAATPTQLLDEIAKQAWLRGHGRMDWSGVDAAR